MELRQSAEDYLETILILRGRQGRVRSVDVAAEMGFSKPSVSYAMKKLRERGLAEMDESGYITLTPAGQEVASRVYERHEVLAHLFMELGVSEETAMADACKIEHVLSEETFARLRARLARGEGEK